MVTFVLLTDLAGAPPRKMSGWDFPRRQTETTGKTPILLTVQYHQYSQLANLFFTFGRSVALYDDTRFSSHRFFFYYTEIALPYLSRLLVKKLVAKRMGERRRKKRSKRRKMGVLL